MTDTKTITIKGRTYKVEAFDIDGKTAYILRGERGAQYGTMRYRENPKLMYLINVSGRFRILHDMGDLTDRRGFLETRDHWNDAAAKRREELIAQGETVSPRSGDWRSEQEAEGFAETFSAESVDQSTVDALGGIVRVLS